MQLAPNAHTGPMESPTSSPITGAREGGRLTKAGLDAGHVVQVEHLPKRFRIICPCGWHSDSRWNRKRTFYEATQHVVNAGREAIEKAARSAEEENLPISAG